MAVTVPKFLLFIGSFCGLSSFVGLKHLTQHSIPTDCNYDSCSLALFYVISHGKKPLPLLAVLPFIYALLDDILNVLNLSNRITPIEDQVAYNFTAALTSIALIVSGLATIWFIVHYYFQENERGSSVKNRTNGRSLEIP